MKLKLFFSMMAVAAMTFTGCNKQTELEINYGRTATLKGKVTLFEPEGAISKVGEGVKVFAKTNYSNLITTNTDETPDGIKTFETTTDKDGNFEFNLPVNENSTTETEYKITTENKLIEDKEYIFDNERIVNLNVNDVENIAISMILSSPVEAKYIIKGKVVTTTGSTSNIPVSGCKVSCDISGNSFTTTTDANGEYTLEIPSSTFIDNSFTIKASFENEDGDLIKGSINGTDGNYTVEGGTYTFDEITLN